MLVPSDLKYNLGALRLVSFLGILPLNFDVKDAVGKVSMKSSRFGKFLFKLWQFCSLIHIFYVSVRAAVFFSDENKQTHHLPALILVWGTIICVAAEAVIAFDLKSDLVIKNFTELFLVLQENKSETPKLKGKAFVRSKNFYDMVTICMPFMLYPLMWIFPLAYFLDPDLPVLFISSISPENRSWRIFSMCFVLELAMFLFYVAVGHAQVFIIQPFIHVTRHSIRRQIKALSDERNSLTLRLLAVEKRIKTIELRVNLFNLGYSSMTYLAKMIFMQFAVGGGFGALLLIKKEPIFTALYGSIFVDAIMFFTILFNRAFDIETASRQLKMDILMQSQRFRLKWKRNEYQRKTRAIRPIGIKIGGFYKVEREAIPIFTDFVIQQIISLMLI